MGVYQSNFVDLAGACINLNMPETRRNGLRLGGSLEWLLAVLIYERVNAS